MNFNQIIIEIEYNSLGKRLIPSNSQVSLMRFSDYAQASQNPESYPGECREHLESSFL